ncbi:hypothetical protein ACHAW6_002205 [Cyclotella cf. meneghiniana]
MVAVKMGGNYIATEPLKSSLEALGSTVVISPSWHVLDKEVPADYKDAIRKNGCTVELTPPDMHHQNIAKCAI